MKIPFDLADLPDHGAATVEAMAAAGVAAAVVAGEVVPVALEVLAAMEPVVKWPPEVATSAAAEAAPVGVVEVPLTNQLPTITEDATHSTKLLCLFLQNVVTLPLFQTKHNGITVLPPMTTTFYLRRCFPTSVCLGLRGCDTPRLEATAYLRV